MTNTIDLFRCFRLIDHSTEACLAKPRIPKNTWRINFHLIIFHESYFVKNLLWNSQENYFQLQDTLCFKVVHFFVAKDLLVMMSIMMTMTLDGVAPFVYFIRSSKSSKLCQTENWRIIYGMFMLKMIVIISADIREEFPFEIRDRWAHRLLKVYFFFDREQMLKVLLFFVFTGKKSRMFGKMDIAHHRKIRK